MKPRPVTLLAAASSLFGLAALHAQTDLFKDDFNAGVHADWTRVDDSQFQGPVQYLAANGGYRIVVPPLTDENYAAGGYSYAVSYRTNLVYENFTLAVDITDVPPAASTSAGLGARMQGVQFTDGNVQVPATGSGYILLTHPVPYDLSLQFLVLQRVDNQVLAPESTVRARFPRVPGREYRLVFTGHGDHLVGQIFDRANPSALLATVQGYDGTYAQGTMGVVALSMFGYLHAANEPVDVTFDNFAVATPEPLNEFIEDFDDGSDANPGFARYDLFGSFGAPPAQFTFADGAMSITAPASVAPEVIGAFAGATLSTPVHADVETSVDFWGWNTSSDARPMFYLTARGRDLGDGTYDYYGLYVSPTSFPEAAGGLFVEPSISITKIRANVPELPSLASVTLTNVTLNASTRYRLRFSVQGPLLSGWLYDLSNPAAPLAELFAYDTSYPQAGYTGFVVGDKGYLGVPRLNSPIQVTVDNFRVRGSVEGPTLAIEPAVVLSWPASSSGHVLEGAERAEGPWTNVGVVPSAQGGRNTVTMKVAGEMKLYRLRKPFINE